MSSTYRLGLTGWPLAHSLSPRLHRAALQASGLSGEYELYPIPPLPEGLAELAELLKRLRQGEITGINVTIPHKQAILPLLDVLTPSTRAIGAANTIYQTGGRLVGENTDAPAFIEDLEQQFKSPEPGKALVLGAGGAARACAYALGCRGWQVFVASRRPEQVEKLVEDFVHLSPAPIGMVQPLPEAARIMSTADLNLVVNATPVGMQPCEGDSPWPEDVSLPSGCLVYDLNYNPPETRLLQQAQRQGNPAASGMGMLVHQAALAFLIWTDLPVQRLPALAKAMHAAI